ncbi:alpha/beta hydrolase [Actinomadura barringtoniae]|uniref:Alpha/beta hydrolase n=1 Tax=Actinomadura barringtoniae TaxID=1427535 RepID=A0A939PF39_9ACTN|nr:alpha/beta hydrolase [Actinomadura barringtoniae]MBO2448559.1 alpha/beta hydrolase [Actinomadura barringtoniae]
METNYLSTRDHVRLAYVDSGGSGEPILALHGAFGRGRAWMTLAGHLGPDWRVIGLDQRGHGLSDEPGDYGREAYLADTADAIEVLGIGPAILVGHSLGAINAFQLATRRPDLVRAFVAVDFPAEAGDYTNRWLDDFPERFPTLRALRAAIGEHIAGFGSLDHFQENAFEDERGWGFHWRPDTIHALKKGVIGDWWEDWTGSDQPALLVRGGASPVVPLDHAKEMAERRPGTELVTIDGAGHDLYLTHDREFGDAVSGFLSRIAVSV